MGLFDQLEDLIGQHAGGGVPAQQAVDHHDALAGEATPDEYHAAAHETVSSLAPHEQEALAQQVQAHANANGIDLGALLGGQASGLAGGQGGALGALGGAGGLAQVLGKLGQGSGGLGGLLAGGGGAGGAVSGSVLSGMVGALAKQMLSRR
jgi:hypothetical protein